MLLCVGDEIDAQYEEQIKEIIELTGTPETAFSIFSEVVKKLFEWDSPEGGALGREGRRGEVGRGVWKR